MDMPQVIEIANGEPVPGTFSDAEMNARLGKLRALMAATGVDVALFTSYHNICYYGAFLYCKFGRDYALVVDRDAGRSLAQLLHRRLQLATFLYRKDLQVLRESGIDV